jgi:hypothetical protein
VGSTREAFAVDVAATWPDCQARAAAPPRERERERERENCSWQNTTYLVRELQLAQTCSSTSGSARSISLSLSLYLETRRRLGVVAVKLPRAPVPPYRILPPSSERLSIAISRNRLGEHLFLRPES